MPMEGKLPTRMSARRRKPKGQATAERHNFPSSVLSIILSFLETQQRNEDNPHPTLITVSHQRLLSDQFAVSI